VKLNRKFMLSLTGVALMLGSVAIIGSAASAKAAKTNASGSITCTAVAGELKFSPPLASNGTTTGSETTTFKGTLGSCTGGDGATVVASSGKVAELTTTNDGNSCAGFSAATLKNATTFTITWKAKPAINPTSITFPAGDIAVATNDEGFTLGGGSGTVTGTGSYPGAKNFAGSSAQASTAPLNLANGLCAGGKPQKDIKIVSGTDTVG
jgi:hypothetical protein